LETRTSGKAREKGRKKEGKKWKNMKKDGFGRFQKEGCLKHETLRNYFYKVVKKVYFLVIFYQKLVNFKL